jgi:SOS-response transcriptional repressor LexA
MPTLITPRRAEIRIFDALGEPCGVMVADPESNEAAFRFRRDWAALAGERGGAGEAPEDAEVLAAIAADLPEKAREMGVRAFLAWVDSTLSNTFRCAAARQSLAADLERAAQRLYSESVRAEVRPYETHLPVLCMAAAGPLLANAARDEEDAEWVDVEGVRMGKEYFLVRVAGHSMEPEIPDGSLCLFRRYAGGSRGGKIMLVHEITDEPGMGRFTIKRYLSAKRASNDGSWEHERIRMHSDNAGFSEWDLDESRRYETAGEFVRVVADAAPAR